MVTEAGRKLRAWRKAQNPPLSGHDAARWLGVSFMTVYRLEQGSRKAGGKMMRAMMARAICAMEDFDAPAVAMCPVCERREEDPVNAGCSQVDCPRKRAA